MTWHRWPPRWEPTVWLPTPFSALLRPAPAVTRCTCRRCSATRTAGNARARDDGRAGVAGCGDRGPARRAARGHPVPAGDARRGERPGAVGAAWARRPGWSRRARRSSRRCGPGWSDWSPHEPTRPVMIRHALQRDAIYGALPPGSDGSCTLGRSPWSTRRGLVSPGGVPGSPRRGPGRPAGTSGRRGGGRRPPGHRRHPPPVGL